jgi:hypothetical protein
LTRFIFGLTWPGPVGPIFGLFSALSLAWPVDLTWPEALLFSAWYDLSLA